MKQHQDKKSMIVIKEDYMRNYCKITYINPSLDLDHCSSIMEVLHPSYLAAVLF